MLFCIFRSAESLEVAQVVHDSILYRYNGGNYVDLSELLSNLLEIAKFDRVKSSRTLGHSHAVPRYSVSHVVVINQVR